jgi:hypothetical protein
MSCWTKHKTTVYFLPQDSRQTQRQIKRDARLSIDAGTITTTKTIREFCAEKKMLYLIFVIYSNFILLPPPIFYVFISSPPLNVDVRILQVCIMNRQTAGT